MSDYEPRAWKCEKCGWVLGYVIRGANRLATLNVLRSAIEPLNVQPVIERAVFYSVFGLKHGSVACDHCCGERTWHMGDHDLADFLEKQKKKTFGLEVA